MTIIINIDLVVDFVMKKIKNRFLIFILIFGAMKNVFGSGTPVVESSELNNVSAVVKDDKSEEIDKLSDNKVELSLFESVHEFLMKHQGKVQMVSFAATTLNLMMYCRSMIEDSENRLVSFYNHFLRDNSVICRDLNGLVTDRSIVVYYGNAVTKDKFKDPNSYENFISHYKNSKSAEELIEKDPQGIWSEFKNDIYKKTRKCYDFVETLVELLVRNPRKRLVVISLLLESDSGNFEENIYECQFFEVYTETIRRSGIGTTDFLTKEQTIKKTEDDKEILIEENKQKSVVYDKRNSWIYKRNICIFTLEGLYEKNKQFADKMKEILKDATLPKKPKSFSVLNVEGMRNRKEFDKMFECIDPVSGSKICESLNIWPFVQSTMESGYDVWRVCDQGFSSI
ncbi:MAG: hypothetical protein FWC41_00945 [Firmicutes bacterium]|nr:hypothetical protein [Bacillota bacterium]